jgi:hypothetical protein
VLGHIADQDEALSIVRALMAGLCPGSYLAITLGTDTNEAFSQAQRQYNTSGAVPYVLRRPEQVPQFFEGLDLVEPGVVPASQWRPDPSPFTGPRQVYAFGGVGRKPLRVRSQRVGGKQHRGITPCVSQPHWPAVEPGRVPAGRRDVVAFAAGTALGSVEGAGVAVLLENP